MLVLHLVSTFPALTETFVWRELVAIRQRGVEVIITELRPSTKRPKATGFDDLYQHVRTFHLLTSHCAGALCYGLLHAGLTLHFLRVILRTINTPVKCVKLLYILMISCVVSYRLRREGVMHVRAHHLHTEAVAAMFVAGYLGIPYSVTCHTSKLNFPRAVVEEAVRGAAFLVPTSYDEREFLYRLGVDRQRIHVIRGIIPAQEFTFRRNQCGSNPPIILAVGRLDFKKGFHVLLRACALLRNRNTKFRSVIVGDGRQAKSLAALREKLLLCEHVELLGKCDFAGVQRWFERATIAAVPSVLAPDGEIDGLPTVILEAFATGVPVVASAIAGIPEIVHDNITGLLVPPDNPTLLADRMEILLKDEDRRRRLAIEARRMVVSDFDRDCNAKKLVGLIQNATKRRCRRLADTVAAFGD